MSKKKIVTDSTSDLSQKYLTDNDINVIPLNLTIDGKSFADQIDISSEAFIEKLKMMQMLKQVNLPLASL